MDFLNFNIGVLGHVDSGKTSLVKTLSQTASTACFDKNPQSKERGITLDLGFSSFVIPCPENLDCKQDNILITLVDCPGHASLLKTIIGGAHIIDMMILVIDITKGMQTQTAECLVIGELTCEKMIVVLNKVDMVPEKKRQATIEKMTKRINATLNTTKFKGSPIVVTCVGPDDKVEGHDKLIETIKSYLTIPSRSSEGPFVFAVDHCFGIKGQGTVLTGTCLAGSVGINDVVEISNLKIEKKIKSIQVFRKSVERVIQGDRAGVCVAQFDPSLLERGLVFTDKAVPTINGAIINISKVKYYKGGITNKMKYHVSIGHETVMSRITFFKSIDGSQNFDINSEYLFQESYEEDANITSYALLEFEQPVQCILDNLVIISRLDMDVNTPSCRLAFYGNILHHFTEPDYHNISLPSLKIFKYKERSGVIERMNDEYTVIGKDLFKKETNIDLFTNLKVSLSTGEEGVIEGSFGQSGKYKINLPDGLLEGTKIILESRKKGKKGASSEPPSSEVITVQLQFKRYVYDKKKMMIQ